jgi:metallo-beta-lactamase family protein
MAERSSEHNSIVSKPWVGGLEAASFGPVQPDLQTRQSGEAEAPVDPLVTFETVPLPSHSSPLKLLHETLLRVLPSNAHISCASFDGSSLFTVLELMAVSAIDRAQIVEWIRIEISEAFPDTVPQIRVIEFDRAPDPIMLAGFRTCYFRHPALRAISLDGATVEFGSFAARDPAKEISVCLGEVQPLIGRKPVPKCVDEYDNELPSPSLGIAAVSARSIALKFWQGKEFRQAGVQWSNYFELDLTRKELRIVQEAQNLAPKNLRRSTSHLSARLPIPYLAVEIVRESSIHDAAAFIKSLLPPEVLRHSILQCAGELRLAILVDSSNSGKLGEIERKLRKDCDAVGSLLIKVRSVVRDSAITEQVFCSFPPEWGFHSVIPSSNGSVALIKSVSGGHNSPGEEYLGFLRDKFPGGVYFEEDRNRSVDASAPLFRRVFSALPTRCRLRSINECRVTGDLQIDVTILPSAQMLRELSATLGGITVHPNKLLAIEPPECVRPAIELIKEYGGALPFFLTPSHGHDSFLGRGGCQRVGGTRLLLNLNGLRPLLDWGGILGRHKKLQLSSDDFTDVDLVILSHGHFDHWGELLEAVLAGFRGPIIMTESTAVAMYPGLVEQASRNRRLRRAIPELYKLIRVVPYDVPIQLSDSVQMTLLPAGHLVGSAQCLFECTSADGPISVLYTGDFRNRRSPLHEKAALPPRADVIIADGTYGYRIAPPREVVEAEFLTKVMHTLSNGGSVFLPVLTLGREPEVLAVLREIRGWLNENKIPIRIVGGSINKINEVYEFLASTRPGDFNEEALKNRPWRANFDCVVRGEKRPGPFERWRKGKGPEIVIAGGGMVSGLEKILVEYCEDERNLLLLTCYQAEGLGRKILEGKKLKNLPNFNMQKAESHLSPGHSSGPETVQFITEAAKDGATVLLVHGDEVNLKSLVSPLMEDGRISNVVIPAQDEYIELKPARPVH